MFPSKTHCYLSLLFIGLLLTACSKSDDQRKFEEQANLQPQHITEMDPNGTPTDGGTRDADDWRIGPDFQGLIKFSQPAIGAYPNPVNLNSQLRIDLDIIGYESINGLQLYAFRDPGKLFGPIYTETQSNISPGVYTILLDPGQFSNAGGSQASGLYRILIYDGRQNLISYGDVQVN